MPQIFLNYYKDGKSDITYDIPTNSGLEKTKPLFVTEKELEDIKNCTTEAIMLLLENNKF